MAAPVQVSELSAAATATTVAVAQGTNPTVGSTNCVWVRGPSTATVTGVADTLGHTYTARGNVTEAGTGQVLYQFTAPITSTGANTVTATYNATQTNRGIAVVEMAGTYDASNTGTDTGNNPTTSVSATNTAQPATVLMLCNDVQGGTPGVGTGFTNVGTGWATVGLNYRLQYKDVTTVASQSGNFANAGFDRCNTGLIIVLPASAPQITGQPTDQSANAGATATFSITETGATSYQWQDNSSGSFADISGATSISYAPTATYAMQGRLFRCNAINITGTTTSASASLRVLFNVTGTGPRSVPIMGAGPMGAGTEGSWIQGLAAVGGSHSTSGALTGQDATIAGTAAHLTLHATSGALSGQAATIAGTAAHQHAAVGALSAQAATISGTAAHLTLHTTSGALAGQAATISGTAAHQHATTGALVAGAATIAGTADHTTAGASHSTSGALAADAATISGTSTHLTLHATSGALTAQAATVSGAAAHQHAATGALTGQAATVSGTATHLTLHTSSGALTGQAAAISGAAADQFATTGALVAQAATISGSAVHTPAGAIRYVIGDGAVNNGNGLFPNAAASPGADGAYTVPPGNSFGSDIEWRMIAGTTLDMGATALTTGNNATIVRFGSGANPIIRGTNSTLLNSSTAVGVSISDISIIRTGGVSGTGYNASQTSGTTLNRVTITGSQINLNPNDATSLTVNGCTFGATSTEYGLRSTQATTTCSGWAITNNTFGGGIGIELQASSAANAAGRYTGLTITGNTFPASASSAIIMQSVMNLTGSAHSLEVLNTTQIRITGGTWPAWTAGQVIFLTGFNNIVNFAERTVVSIIGDTLTVSGAALAVEAAGVNKGAGLIDPTRMFVAPEIAYNTCTGQEESPMLLASIYGGRIHHNTVSGQVGSGTKTAAAIELIYASDGLVVDFNTIGPTTGYQDVDNAGIFTDGGCDGVIVRNNTISNVIPGGQDNSGQGSAMFYTRNCIHELNTYTNCYRGTWAGGAAGSGNIIRNNTYTSCDIGIDINCSPAVGAFDYLTGHTFSNNRINVFSCPDGLTIEGAPSSTGRDGAGGVPMRKWRYYGDEQPEAPAPVAAPAPIPQAVAAPAPAGPATVSLTAMLSRMAEQRVQIRADMETQQRLEQEPLQIATQAIERAALALAIEEQAIEDDDEEAIGMALQMLL